jgi:hypothetical protein
MAIMCIFLAGGPNIADDAEMAGHPFLLNSQNSGDRTHA